MRMRGHRSTYLVEFLLRGLSRCEDTGGGGEEGSEMCRAVQPRETMLSSFGPTSVVEDAPPAYDGN